MPFALVATGHYVLYAPFGRKTDNETKLRGGEEGLKIPCYAVFSIASIWMQFPEIFNLFNCINVQTYVVYFR